ADPVVRLITLTGPGGAGKTRLALELARAIAAEGATRVLFVQLAAIRNPAFVASAIAEALGLSDVTALDLPSRGRVRCAGPPTVAAICRRLDALPLALELAAPWIKVLTAEVLLRRLTHDVLLSTIGPRDLPERQQTIGATVAWSYQLLGPNEQRAFRRLGALPGRFPIEAAAAVLAGREGSSAGIDEALGAAAALIDESLLLRAQTSLAT